MCDYSLHHVATRPASIEDKLVVTKFNNSITRGFAAVGEPQVAVCLLPGTDSLSTPMSSASHHSGSGYCRTRRLVSGSHASDRSIWTIPLRIMMRWSSPTAK